MKPTGGCKTTLVHDLHADSEDSHHHWAHMPFCYTDNKNIENFRHWMDGWMDGLVSGLILMF